jgi:hypothetical protein
MSLKEQALLERFAEMIPAYESRIADLRVEVTNLTQRVNELTAELGQYDEPETVVENTAFPALFGDEEQDVSEEDS